MGKALAFGTKDCRFEPCQGHAFRNAASVRRSVGLHGRLVQCQFARMVEGLDLRSNASSCAWARTPQLAQVLLPSWGLLFPCGWRGMPGPALLQFSGGGSSLQIGCPLYTPGAGLAMWSVVLFPGLSWCRLCCGALCLAQGIWRNGSASDSRSEGWEFESLCPHFVRPRRVGPKFTRFAAARIVTRGDARTHNLLLKGKAPYPLGNTGVCL